jgi:hypothetical protein
MAYSQNRIKKGIDTRHEHSFAGLNQQIIPINKANHHISPVMTEHKVKLEPSIMLYFHHWINGVSIFDITSHEFI